MKFLSSILFLILVALTFSTPANANVSGNELLNNCKSYLTLMSDNDNTKVQDPVGVLVGASFCKGYIESASEIYHSTIESFKEDQKVTGTFSTMLWCSPVSTVVTEQQAIMVAIQFLEELKVNHPESLKEPANIIVDVGLRRTWPCPK